MRHEQPSQTLRATRDVVIAKLSANRAYGTSPDEESNREEETIELLRAIAGATN
jgi:hypothetical protein